MTTVGLPDLAVRESREREDVDQESRLLIYLRRTTLTIVSSTVTIASSRLGAVTAPARGSRREARSGAIRSATFSTMPGSFLSS